MNDEEQLSLVDNKNISVNDIQNLYDKFCFLNEYEPKHLQDPKNVLKLNKKGFKLSQNNLQIIEYYTNLILADEDHIQ